MSNQLCFSHNADAEFVCGDLRDAVEMYVSECVDNDEKPLDVVQMHQFRHKFDEAEKIMVAHLDENERPTGQKTPLKTMMDMLVEQNGEDFFYLAIIL